MKQKNLFLAVSITLIIIAIILVAIQLKSGSSSFTINVYSDTTSSGGSRFFNSTLAFQDDKLVSGWQTYETWPGTGGHNIIECLIDPESLDWVDKSTKGACESKPGFLPLDKKGVLQKISSGEFKPADECGHLDICYRII